MAMLFIFFPAPDESFFFKGWNMMHQKTIPQARPGETWGLKKNYLVFEDSHSTDFEENQVYSVMALLFQQLLGVEFWMYKWRTRMIGEGIKHWTLGWDDFRVRWTWRYATSENRYVFI